MTKDEAVNFLRKNGYIAENHRGVVTIVYDTDIILKNYEKIRKQLFERGYNSSLGIKPNSPNYIYENPINHKTLTNNDDFDDDTNSSPSNEILQNNLISLFENNDGQLSFL